MREIKFRAWIEDHYEHNVNIKNGKYHRMISTGFAAQYDPQYRDYDVEQFTGIQDSEGVDIYEGDVLVDLPFTERYGPSLCVWDGDRAGFAIQNQGESNMQYHVDFWKRARVVGNIHQHVHLLEE